MCIYISIYKCIYICVCVHMQQNGLNKHFMGTEWMFKTPDLSGHPIPNP